jgi:threonine/homoserine/homoserine lactone efflux protein
MNFDLWIFSMMMWAAQFSPGPDMLLLIHQALNYGRNVGWSTVLGIVTGLGFHCAVIGAGYLTLMSRYPTLYQGVRWLAAAYLLWLAVQLWQTVASSRKQKIDFENAKKAVTCRAAYQRGLTCNLLNLKAFVFLAGTAATVPRGNTSMWWAMTAIVLGQALVGWSLFVWFLGKTKVREFFLRWQVAMNRVFGSLLAVMAIKLLVE